MFNTLLTSPWTITALLLVPALAGAVVNQGPATIGPDQLRIVLGTPAPDAAPAIFAAQDTTQFAHVLPAPCTKSGADTGL